MRASLATVFALTALLAAGAARATEYYVAPNGSDSNAGTMAAPWATLQKGATTAAAGDTVWIRGGTYKITTPATSPSNVRRGSAAGRGGGQPRGATGPAVAHLVLLPRAARALRVAADLGERVVLRGHRAAAYLGLPGLGGCGVGEVLRLAGLLEPLGPDLGRAHERSSRRLELLVGLLGGAGGDQRVVGGHLVLGVGDEVTDHPAHRLLDLELLTLDAGQLLGVRLLVLDGHLEVEHEADGLLLDAVHHRGEHVEALALVLDQGVALRVGAEVDALAEVVHLVEVLAPLAVQHGQQHPPLQLAHDLLADLLL